MRVDVSGFEWEAVAGPPPCWCPTLEVNNIYSLEDYYFSLSKKKKEYSTAVQENKSYFLKYFFI
jgi:hypothetical protein